MNYLSFSCSVAALAGAALLVGHASSGSAQAKGTRQPAARAAPRQPVRRPVVPLVLPLRKSITALTPAELASLRKGFAQMIAWNSAPHGSANFKRSLTYWANMHAYFGQGCAPASGLNAQGMNGLSAQAPQTPDENTTWCTCEHGSVQFLTWHRMYLYYFEKVLQAAAGDPKLRLPYWDYETDGHLPQAYRDPTYVLNGQTVPNPLYIASRQAQLNAGTAALTAAVVSTSGAMPSTSYTPFTSALEQTPHGAVHCATGVANCPTGYMGAVPAAGNDPIFYSHHANIDRLYECWLKVNPAARLPSGSILTASFSFIDGAGNLVTKTVASMKTTQQLGYGYTAGGGCPRVRIVRPLPRLAKSLPLLGPTEISRGTTSPPVRLQGAGAPRQATLVLEGVTADAQPGVMFEVALQAPNGRRAPVGVINFFNATAPRHGTMDMARAAPMGTRSFDATEALQALGGAPDAQLVVVPTTGLTGPSISHAGPPTARATVRFTAARLELR